MTGMAGETAGVALDPRRLHPVHDRQVLPTLYASRAVTPLPRDDDD